MMKMKYFPFHLMRTSIPLLPLDIKRRNMMSYNPFENFDDALFHDCGNEENS
jgi:hypothetical protein